MQMEIFMKVNGKMIRHMAMVTIPMPMELLTVVSGKMISNMVRALKHGPMVRSMKVNISRAKSTTAEH